MTALMAFVVFACAGLLLALSASAAAADSCPNAQFRTGPSANLPDCRAYEMVSPVDKNSGGVQGPLATRSDGNAIAYWSLAAFAGSQSNLTANYLATRSASGWTTTALNPPAQPVIAGGNNQFMPLAFSTDLSEMLIGTTYPISPNDQTLGSVPSAATNVDDYLRSSDGSYTWVSTANPDAVDTTGKASAFGGASADLSRIFFQTAEPLTPQTQGSTVQNLYEWRGGTLTTVNLDAGGNLLPGGAGVGRGEDFNSLAFGDYGETPFDPTAVSTDGSTVFFTSPLTGTRELWVWVNGKTSEVSVSQASATAGQPAPDGASFLVASTDGSTVLFDSSDQLTDAAPSGGGIYSYQVSSGALSFLTPLPTGSTGTNTGGLLAASPDLSWLYLCDNGASIEVFHAGMLSPVAAATCSAPKSTSPVPGPASTPDAGYVFTSSQSLTGYDNNGHVEAYLYRTADGSLTCVSCRPDNTPAQGDASLSFVNRFTIPARVQNLTDDGDRVFFDSTDQLVPQDTSATTEVYEWEHAGTGTCTTAAGCISLISSGTDPNGAAFAGASENGNDVFFITFVGLVPQDTNGDLDLYDARVDGGFPPPATPASCAGDACQGTPSPQPAPLPTAASVTFSGPGNVQPNAPKAIPKVTPKVTLLTRAVRGVSFLVRVKVSGRGQITISSASTKTVRRSVARADTYALRIALTPRSKRALQHKRQLQVKLRVRYKPAGASATVASVKLTVRPLVRSSGPGKARRAVGNRGGVR